MNLQAEYGSESNVRFMQSATMYDSNGKPILCACGNDASSGIVGHDAYQMFCSSCSPLNKAETYLVYRKPIVATPYHNNAYEIDMNQLLRE